MGCNCNNTEKNYTTLEISENNINSSDNFLLGGGLTTSIINNDSEDHNHRYHPDQPLLKFLVNKNPCDNLEAAKTLINTKVPPLVLGQPAAVQYKDASGYIKLLFCIGAAPDSSAIMFQIADEGGSGDCSALVARIVALEQEMINVDSSIADLKTKDSQQDISINSAINSVNDISTKVATYDNSINIAVTYATEAKTTADDVSSRVGTYDNSINAAINTANDASAVAYDVSSKITPDGMKLIVQYLIDNKLINNINASTAKDASNAEYAIDASNATYALNAETARTANHAADASIANYATDSSNAARANGMVWYDVDE